MARSRKKSTTKRRRTTRRRRSVSGVKDLDIMQILLLIGGAVGAKALSNKLASSSNATLSKFSPYIPVAGGIAVTMFAKNQTLQNIALGLIASGGVTALGSTGLKVIAGMENSIARVGYPVAPKQLPYRAAQVAGPAGSQGLTKGTHSNFSGSRMSQLNTIAGVIV